MTAPTDLEVGDLVDADVAGVALVAALVDELVDGAGDPAYLAHLRAHGHVVVARVADQVVGYAATHRIGDVEMVTDLFVHPEHHGHRVGSRLLDAAWTSSDGPRMTFASRHPHALPVYVRAGMAPRWPLLWLAGDPAALRSPDWPVTPASLDEVVDWERAWLGVDRRADYGYWQRRPAGELVTVRDDSATVVGVGALGGAGAQYGVAHFTAADPAVADRALRAALRTLGGQAFVALPGVHPALPSLLAARWRISEADYWLATHEDSIAARCQALSPGLG